MLHVKLECDESIVTVRGSSVIEEKSPATAANKSPKQFNPSCAPLLNGNIIQGSTNNKLIQTISLSTSTTKQW